MLGKLLNNLANRIDPKFILLVDGKKEKYNSVMVLKMRIKDLKEKGIEYTFKEMW